MPDVMRIARRILIALVVLAGPLTAHGQQPDSVAVRDSTRRDRVARADAARADSVRADSVRRSELARIRGEPRASADIGGGAPTGRTTDQRRMIDSGRSRPRVAVAAASVTGDMIADLSPRAAARATGSRVRARDIEGAIEASYGARTRGVLSLTLTDDGTTQRLTSTDAAVVVSLPVAQASVLVGRTALPFGRVARLHRHELMFPDQPLPVRALLGADGLRGTGVQLRAGRDLAGSTVTLELAAADRFGTRVDSLHPGESYDQSLAGIAAGGRIGAQFATMRSRVDLGVSSITGKREQPIGCVYEGTVGPVPCPEAVNAANTRLTVFGADGQLAWGGDALVINGEWLRMIVGAADMPVFGNAAFAPFYGGVSGTYDGGYVGARMRLTGVLAVGARAEWLQNPAVAGLNDAWAGGYVDVSPLADAHLTASYQRRVPSSSALATLPIADRDARDRIVLRGTVVIGRHPDVGRE